MARAHYGECLRALLESLDRAEHRLLTEEGLNRGLGYFETAFEERRAEALQRVFDSWSRGLRLLGEGENL